MGTVNDIQFGARVRAVRLRLGWRQSDVAAKAGVGRSTVQRIESGQVARTPLGVIRAVLAALDMDLRLVAIWRGGELDRLVDEGHALLGGLTTSLLERLGWELRVETSYSIYGERGSIDLLAWHAGTRTLLVIELKSSLNSVEETLRRLDEKVRLAPQIAARFGWVPAITAFALVLPDDSTSRRRVQRHGRLLDRALPLRGRVARSWLQSPVGGAGMLLFLSDAHGEGRIRRIAPRRRVRQPKTRLSSA